jgi:hypothetical protein
VYTRTWDPTQEPVTLIPGHHDDRKGYILDIIATGRHDSSLSLS